MPGSQLNTAPQTVEETGIRRKFLECQPSAVDGLIAIITRDLGHELRASQPRDIIQHVCWTARYQKANPRLDEESVSLATRAYFLAPR